MKNQTSFRRHRIIKVVTLLVTCHLSLVSATAQSFTQRIQQTGTASGKVTIHQDAAIDELVNGKPVAAPTTKKTTTQPATTQPTAKAQQKTTAEASKDEKKVAVRVTSEQQADSVATISTEPTRTRKVMGYRIQVFVGGKTRSDRQKAEQTGSALRTLFPGQKVYVHFYSPRWICRMGNYPTMAEAREMLDEVVRMGYDTATIVRGKITVPY